MSDAAPKWAVGNAYGPVLSSTQLYLLQAAEGCKCLELNPILTHTLKSFHLVFNLSDGSTGGYNNADSNEDLPFTQQDEPATIPRVETLYIISRLSPWVTTITASNPKAGVTLGDVVSATWHTYGDHSITDAEWNSLGVREQERTRRASIHNQMMKQNPGWNGAYPYSPPVNPHQKFRRADWLRDKMFFDGVEQDDDYAVKRLGFKAPNIFIMSFCG